MEIGQIPVRVLHAARQRLGSNGSFDTSKDEDVKEKSPIELMQMFTGWHMGDEEWADIIIGLYEEMQEAVKP